MVWAGRHSPTSGCRPLPLLRIRPHPVGHFIGAGTGCSGLKLARGRYGGTKHSFGAVTRQKLPMSVYQGWKPQQEYPKPEIAREEKRDAVSPPTANEDPPPAHLRKARPVLTLLPRTIAWMDSLPEDFRPNVLAIKYARIANNFALMWQSPDECHRYFDNLLIDRRGKRKGFPVDVLHDIQRLQRLYLTLYPVRENPWLVVPR